MKILIVYDSQNRELNLVCNIIVENIGADLLVLRKKAVLQPDKNPQDYDLIFFGVSARFINIFSSLISFLKKNEIQNKKVAIFCCYKEFVGCESALNKMKKILMYNEIIGDISLLDPLKNMVETKVDVEKWLVRMNI